MLALQGFKQQRVPQHFPVQAFDGQEHDAKISRVWCLHVLFGDVLGERLDGGRERFLRLSNGLEVTRLPRIQQILVALQRELGIDGEPNGFVVACARHADGEFHTLRATRSGGDVLFVLLPRQQLLEDVPQLVFTEDALGLDVVEHLFQIPHPCRKVLHFSKSLVDLLEAFADQLEALTQTLLERHLKLFIHRLPHLFQPLAVVFSDFLQLLLSGLSNVLDRGNGLLVLGVQLLDQILKLQTKRGHAILGLLLHALGEKLLVARQFLPLRLRQFGSLLPVAGKFVAHV